MQDFGLTKQRLDGNVFANLKSILVLLGFKQLGIDLKVVSRLVDCLLFNLSFSENLLILREGSTRDSVFSRQLPVVQLLGSDFGFTFGLKL